MDVGKVLSILREAAGQYAATNSLDATRTTKRILGLAYDDDWTGDHLHHFCQVYYTWSLETPENVEASAALTQHVMPLEIDGQLFRKPWFQRLQADFQSAPAMRAADRSRWINFASYLCKMLVNLNISGAPVMVLLAPVCSCLEMLLTNQDTTNEEIECGVKQLVNCGPLLLEYYAESLHRLMTRVRHKILAVDTPTVGQTFLLEAFEMYSGGWKLKASAKEYKDRLFEVQVPVRELHLD